MTGMFGKPLVQSLEGAFAERKWGVAGILDLRHRRAPDAGEDAQRGAVELAVRKLGTEEEQRSIVVVEQIASPSLVSRSETGGCLVM